MCGSSGPSADQIYEEEYKVDYGDLPSLSMSPKVDRGSRNSYSNVRTGSKRRSLLAPMMQMTLDQGAQ